MTGFHHPALRVGISALAGTGAIMVIAGMAPVSANVSAPVSGVAHEQTNTLNINATTRIRPQAQQQTNWCWSATGTTIAVYKGKNVNQNQFCNLAFGRSKNSSCPNDQAALENDQTAFRALGMKAGPVTYRAASFSEIQRDINADSPVMARVEWSSGGGHMMDVYGYSGNNVQYYDPWPSNRRTNVASYDDYVENNEFSWTHGLIGIRK